MSPMVTLLSWNMARALVSGGIRAPVDQPKGLTDASSLDRPLEGDLGLTLERGDAIRYKSSPFTILICARARRLPALRSFAQTGLPTRSKITPGPFVKADAPDLGSRRCCPSPPKFCALDSLGCLHEAYPTAPTHHADESGGRHALGKSSSPWRHRLVPYQSPSQLTRAGAKQ
jgi:hypothetical protein